MNRIAEFIDKYGNINYPVDELRESIPEFIKNGTFSLSVKDGEILGVILYNINHETADVLECVIHPNHRSGKLLRYLAYQGWAKFPFLKYIKFEKRKEAEVRPRVIELRHLFKGEKDNGKQGIVHTTSRR